MINNNKPCKAETEPTDTKAAPSSSLIDEEGPTRDTEEENT